MSSWSPICLALALNVGFAAIYEPTRLALLPYFDNLLGGVGGVGGLANLSTSTEACLETLSPRFRDVYCYKTGIFGGPFTELALVTLAFWVGPWFLASATLSLGKSQSSNLVSPIALTKEPFLSSFMVFWIGINALWFIVPLSVFWFSLTTDHELDSIATIAKHILAVSLASAHPLSWNLMLVAIPTGGMLSRLLDTKREQMFECHRFIAYCTAFWAFLHGFGELVYLLITKSKSGSVALFTELNIRENGENLIYWFGLLCFLVMACHVVAAYCRKMLSGIFRPLHQILALTLLLLAAAHWWPFALFFVPATAVHGCGLAILLHYRETSDSVRNSNLDDNLARSTPHSSSLSFVPPFSKKQAGFLLLVSLSVSSLSLYIIWMWRQSYMQTPTANLYVPFLFPPLSMIVGLVASSTSIRMCLQFVSDQDEMGHTAFVGAAESVSNNALPESVPLLDELEIGHM